MGKEVEGNKRRSLNYSQLKRAAKERVVPVLKEEDLEEKFVRGTFYPSACKSALVANVIA